MALEPARERSMNIVVPTPLHPSPDPVQALDIAVQEVFECMLGLRCMPQLPTPQEIFSTSAAGLTQTIRWQHPVSAILGFAGKISGSCTMSAEPAAVAAMARHLLSPAILRMHPITGEVQAHDTTAQDWPHVDPHQLNDTLLDSFGEICNMIAGGWKNRIPGLDSGCALSVPTIVSGSDYVLHPVGDRLLVERIYHFNGYKILLAIRCEDKETRIL